LTAHSDSTRPYYLVLHRGPGRGGHTMAAGDIHDRSRGLDRWGWGRGHTPGTGDRRREHLYARDGAASWGPHARPLHLTGASQARASWRSKCWPKQGCHPGSLWPKPKPGRPAMTSHGWTEPGAVRASGSSRSTSPGWFQRARFSCFEITPSPGRSAPWPPCS